MRTIVVGGGIGGLSLARELTLRGLPVTVLERAPTIAPVGAGIIMNPNAMAVLEANGLADRLRRHGWPYLARETYDRRGRSLGTRDYRPLYDAGRLAVGLLVHRAELHHTLHASLPPGTLRLGMPVQAVEVADTRIRVRTENGETLEGDLLVAADGVRSTVREQVFGRYEPVYLGYRSHRLVVRNVDRLEHFTEFLGRGTRIGLVPISPERLYVWTTFNSAHESRAWGLESAAAFRALFAEFTDARVQHVLAQVTTTDGLLTTDIEEVHQPRWVDGRVVLLGDAAHALTPNMGQGAGMAMEDAAALAQAVRDVHGRTSSLAEALAAWETRRRPRVETITRISRVIGEEGQWTSSLRCWLRNRRYARDARDTARVHASLERLLSYPPVP